MDIDFANTRLKKSFNEEKKLVQEYGRDMATTIKRRMAVLVNAKNLAQVPTSKPTRRHQLTQDRDENFAVDLIHPYRLVFRSNHDEIPRKEDGGIDLDSVTAIEILEVVDYH